jgi:hypothetical protein
MVDWRDDRGTRPRWKMGKRVCTGGLTGEVVMRRRLRVVVSRGWGGC